MLIETKKRVFTDIMKRLKAAMTLGFIVISLLMQVTLGAPKASAQIGSNETPTGTGQEAVCRGDRNWAAYGAAIWNQFMDPEDLYQYYLDILYRSDLMGPILHISGNYCWYQDIYGLIKRADKAREQVRTAFYNCTSTDQLVNNYYRLEAEIYFLRNYVQKVQVGKEEKYQFVTNPDQKWLNFTDSMFKSATEKRDYYNQLKGKFGGRLAAYDSCRNDDMDSLVFRFKEDIEFLKDTVKQAGKSISQKAGRLAGTATGLWNSIKSGEYFTNMLQARINGMPCPVLGTLIGSEEQKKAAKEECKAALDDIMAAIDRNSPAWSMITNYDVHTTAQNVKNQSKQILQDTDAMARYELQYYEGSDFMAKELVQRLNALYNIIDATMPYEKKTINCVRAIENAQCSNISVGG
ncbi:hypothetical protein KBB06_04525 [Candidatus Gracilibacteria bacterium]|nr:hypothetical protein [Candidatus Gracilibacteria bacterium]